MNKEKFNQSQKDCAKILGISLSEYNKNLKSIKRSKLAKSPYKEKKVMDILTQLGLSKKDLKKRVY